MTRPDIKSHGTDHGIARLLENFGHLLGRESTVHLCHRHPGGYGERADMAWTVWEGAPAGSGGSQWGAGTTPAVALRSAYVNAVEAIFEGRINGDPTED